MATVKTAFSIPDSLDADLGYIARKLNVSKSALVTSLLHDAARDVAALFREHDAVVASGDVERIKRFRGDSIPIIMSRVDALYSSARDEILGGDDHGTK